MDTTSLSFLEQLREGPRDEAWSKMVQVYSPLLHRWLGRYQLQDPDRDDLVQETLTALLGELPAFEHNQRPGAFRRYLRTILYNRLQNHWRRRKSQPLAGDSECWDRLHELEDPDSNLSKQWDDDFEKHVLRQLLDMIRPEFQDSTWQAFERLALAGSTIEETSRALKITPNAAFIAKSRVLNRLKHMARSMLD